VTGEAGLGKSRLLAEARVSLQDIAPSVSWFEGQSLSYQQSGSYVPWRQVVRRSIGAGETDDPAEVRRKLRTACTDLGLADGDAGFLEALLAVESEATLAALRDFDGEALARGMAGAVRGLVSGLARTAPVILVFDDLHWTDQASLDLLREIAGLVREVPLLVLAVTRPDRTAGVWSLRSQVLEMLAGDALEAALHPLTGEDARRLLAGLLTTDDLPPQIAAAVLEKSEGNPFYVEEVLRMLIDDGRIVRDGDRWTVTGELEALDVPETLDGVLTARIDRLSGEAREVLQVASVIGRRFYAGILAEVMAES
jgi:predicted ATPase